LEVVQELLARGAAVDAAWSFATPLYIASQNGHLAIVRELLVRGAAVDTALNAGYTPLLIASQEGHLEVVRVLLAHGAAPGVVSNDGSTPLSRAYGAIAQLLHAAVAGAAP
jgi:ankyrin repeat protein